MKNEKHYYNEFDPFAAAWLRALIGAGELPAGDVDTRSITEVQASELTGYRQCHFFAGIGGWAFALKLAGVPSDTPLWTGSCPCQPFSDAGLGLGEADPRHLWPEFRRLITHGKPPVVFGEQVASKDGRTWLSGVRADVEALGYGFGAADLCAAGVGEKSPQIEETRDWLYALADAADGFGNTELAGMYRDCAGWLGGIIVGPAHIRQRLWWVADAGGTECGWWAQPGRQHGGALHTPDRCGTDRMAHAEHDAGRAEHERESGRQADASPTDGSVARADCQDVRTGGVAHPEHNGRRLHESQRRSPERTADGRTCSGMPVNGMGDAIGQGLEGHARDGNNGDQPGRIGAGSHGSTSTAGGWCRDSGLVNAEGNREGPGCQSRKKARYGRTDDRRSGTWGEFDLVHCRDGKVRRIEPGTFPLAHGIPGRVGRLRGYGNAIVPQVAAEFIKAFIETKNTAFNGDREVNATA